MKTPSRIVIIGATSSIAEHCTRLWCNRQPANAPLDIILVGRSSARLEHIAQDLKVRTPHATIETKELDFIDPIQIDETIGTIATKGIIDIVLIAHGLLAEQSECESNLDKCAQSLAINGLSPALFAESCAKHMRQQSIGRIAIIGSVAGDRGRKSNYVYGAAKGMLARYAQGLQHRFAHTGIKISLIKPGPTATPMTAHLQNEGSALAPVRQVAEQIVRGIEKGKAEIYTPGHWKLIMWVIRHLPAFVFNRLNI